VTASKLHARGIHKLVDIRTVDAALLREAVGSQAAWLQQLASGVDDRPVVAEHDPKSSGSENTFERDLTDLETIRAHVRDMAHDAAGWLERRVLYARTVTLKVRYNDFTTITRSHTDKPTREADRRAARAVWLLEKTEAGHRPVRLLGVSVHNLSETLDVPKPTARAKGKVSDQPRLPFDEA
jgi:DNA polymerase IV